MLSTSNKTKFQYQYLLIAVLILALVSFIALYQSGVFPTFSVGQAPATVDLSWPPRPDFSHLNEKAIIPVTGSSEGLAVYHQSEWGASVAIQNGMDLYHQSEWNAAQAQGMSFQLGREADAARYTVAAEAFAAKEAASLQRGRDADAARYSAMAKLYAARSESIQNGPTGR